MTEDTLEHWVRRWKLTPDGEGFPGASGELLPVLSAGRKAMLKLFGSDDERRGASVLAWWNGAGAVEVLNHSAEAILMARAETGPGLAGLSGSGGDEQATAIICRVVRHLHGAKVATAPAGLPPLRSLFRKLVDGGHSDSRLEQAAKVARRLLAEPAEPVVLHGDIHHGNILNFGADGWRAIDPWGYVGERAYDYANILSNPDLEQVTAPGRLERGLVQIAAEAALDRDRLRAWTFAHAGLAAVWHLEDGTDPARSWAVLDLLAGGQG
jgi:streptomycin 6-kinase